MPTVKLSPVFNGQSETSTGAPASGYKLYTYAAGSSTLQATYTDSTGNTAQANPIVLNSLGFADNPIWLQSGLSYKFVLTDAAGVTIKTIDNVSGINDTTTSVSQWQSTGLTPTYVSASSFTLAGDQTSEFHVGRRLQFTVTAGTVYGTIQATAYTTLTTVTMTMDSGMALDSGLSVVNLSILRADSPAIPIATAFLKGKAGTAIASAATVNLSTATGNTVHITGTTAITAFTMTTGQVMDLIFDGVLTLTHHATNNNLPGGVNIKTAANDRARYFYDGTTVYCLSYAKADGTSVIATSKIQPITASVASNALTLTINPTTLDFRSATLADGTVNTRVITSPISMTVSAGSTLGTVSGQAARLILLAIDNAGTVELAVANLSGGVNLDETTLISTTAEGGAGAADSASAVYSTTARTSVPFRVVGFIDITEATAGTWVTAPTTIQGAGGQALAALSSLGYGQSWQDVTGSRSASTTYYNITGRTIKVFVSFSFTSAGTPQLTVNGHTFNGAYNSSGSATSFIDQLVPPGGSYSASSTGSATISAWKELR